MGNVVSMIMISKTIEYKGNNGNNRETEYIKEPILSSKYCFYCKKNFKDKIEYNEHLRYCKNGEL